MPLLDDAGQPIFPEATTGQPPIAQPPPDLAPQPDAAAAPPAADVPFEDAVEPYAAAPEPAPVAPPLAPVAPAPIDWDSPDNPHRAEAQRSREEAEWLRRQAQQAQQTAAQMQAHALQQARQQSQQRRTQLLTMQQALNNRVGDLAPEDFQRQSAVLTRQVAQEFQRAEAEVASIEQMYQANAAHMVWDQAVAQAAAAYALTPDQAAWLREHAQNEADLHGRAGAIKAEREREAATQTQIQSLTNQLAQLTQSTQQRRSDQAQARARGGADRAGGTGATPVPTPAPTAPLGILRELLTGDRDTPLRPW